MTPQHTAARYDGRDDAGGAGTAGKPASPGGRARPLVGALWANVALSGACGLTLLVGGRALAPTLGADGWLLTALGAGLLVFAADISWLVARRPRHLAVGAHLVSSADAAWVAGAVALLALAPSALTRAGRWALAEVTVAVAAVAAAQVVGLRRLRAGARSATGSTTG